MAIASAPMYEKKRYAGASIQGRYISTAIFMQFKANEGHFYKMESPEVCGHSALATGARRLRRLLSESVTDSNYLVPKHQNNNHNKN